MTQLPRIRWGFIFVLMVSVTCMFQICSAAGKDPFALTSKSVDKNNGPSDVEYIDDGYAWGFGDLGFMLNGHGLPDRRRTLVITHKSAEGQTELIWPVFINYGDNEENAVVLDHTLVFTTLLPNGSPVLMAHRVGEPPMVISAAVLRLAAQRLGTSVIVPGTDYYFVKVRLPPDRIWLKGQPVSASQSYPPQGVFKLELTSEDLRKVIDETRRLGKLSKANKFDYLAEKGAPIRISAQDAKEIGAIAKPTGAPQTTPVIYKTTRYTPRYERIFGHVQLDAANHYAYFSTVREPGRILKVALGSDSQTPPTVVGAAVFEGEEDKPFNSWIDPQGGYAYFGTDYPGHLVKVALGSSNTPPYRVGSVLIEENWNVGAGVLDTASGYGCFQVGNQLFKFRLGKGDEPPVIVSQVEIPKEVIPISFVSAVIDPNTHYAYFGSDWIKIYKMALGKGDSPPRFIGSVTLQEDEFGLRGALINPKNGCAWFTSQHGSLVEISLGEKDEPPRRIGALKVASPYQYLMNTFGRDNAGYAYLGTMGGGKTGDPECCKGGVLKIALGKGDELPQVVSFMPLPEGINIEEGIVDPINRILYLGVDAAGAGCKVLKLSLGEGDAPPKILVETRLYPK